MEKNGSFLKKLLATFRVEAAEHVAAISKGLIELEKTPSAERQTEIIETVFRESHSMKGAARTVNLSVIEGICQSLEGVLSALKRKDIILTGELLDLLHRSVNELEACISEETPSEKDRIGDLSRELDNAARGISLEGPGASAEIRTEIRNSLQQQPPSEESAPSLRKVMSDSMRISKHGLDSILLQAEGFLSAKQLMAQRTAELREVIGEIAALKKEWREILPEMRKAADEAKKGGSGMRARKMMNFLDAKGERIAKLYDALSAIGKAAEHDSRAVAAMTDSLLEDLKTISMLPFSTLLEMMPKVVRDLSHDRDKDARFISQGGELEIDRRILDEMREPLIHLVRNCIDHGIEKSGERTAVNKSPVGIVSISAAHREGKSFEIIVSDDGAGVDIARIRSSSVSLGLLSPEEAEGMETGRLLPFIFRSGVTTSPIITDISGRGIGLAIVQERVGRLGGSIFCETSEGKGTAFHILLPLTLATFRGVLVRVDDSRFVIPVTGLERTVKVGRDEIRTVENRETITVEGLTVPFVPLRSVLEYRHREKGGNTGFVHATVLGAGEDRIAFGVDEILHEQEVLVKDLGKQLVRVRNVSGATVLGTGEVIPVLNVSDLLKSAVTASPGEVRTEAGEAQAVRKSVLVVEDSITARTLLKTILEAAGYDVQTAVDGIDAITTLRSGEFDIVVSDIEMPRMNGLDLTATIRADKRLSELPVVLVTALESREDRERGIDVGANAYIVKSSFDQSNLLQAMKRLL